jgi:hypothetical protein
MGVCETSEDACDPSLAHIPRLRISYYIFTAASIDPVVRTIY